MSTHEWKTVKVFISSTFNDMHAERDYLVKKVFPGLQDWCEARKLRLVEVDLRWGITEHDATCHKNVVKVCLSSIEETRPFFLCFLGQRYGWIPQADDLAPDTLSLFPLLEGLVDRVSVTEMEIRHSIRALGQPNRRHAQSPASTIPTQFFYLRDPSYAEKLPREPAALIHIYTDAPNAEQAKCLESLKDYLISSGQSCRVYQARWHDELPYRTPELTLPLNCPSCTQDIIRRWQDQWKQAGIQASGSTISPDLLNAAHLHNESLTKGRLSDFTVINEQGCTGNSLANAVVQDLQDALQGVFGQKRGVQESDEIKAELEQHERFLFEHQEGFIARGNAFAEVDAYLEVDERRPYVLFSEAGMGKSALLAGPATHRHFPRCCE